MRLIIKLLSLRLWIGRYHGIDAYLHWSWFAIPILASLGGWFFFSLVMGVFASVLLHEYGHAITAQKLGLEVVDITMLPIGGMARVKMDDFDPIQELKVVFAGPMVNFILASLLIASGVLVGFVNQEILSVYLLTLGVFNVWIGSFNLLPIFPMDGGRILRSVLSMATNQRIGTVVAGRSGQAFCLAFAGLSVWWGIYVWVLIAGFLAMASQAEISALKQAKLSSLPTD